MRKKETQSGGSREGEGDTKLYFKKVLIYQMLLYDPCPQLVLYFKITNIPAQRNDRGERDF